MEAILLCRCDSFIHQAASWVFTESTRGRSIGPLNPLNYSGRVPLEWTDRPSFCVSWIWPKVAARSTTWARSCPPTISACDCGEMVPPVRAPWWLRSRTAAFTVFIALAAFSTCQVSFCSSARAWRLDLEHLTIGMYSYQATNRRNGQ